MWAHTVTQPRLALCGHAGTAAAAARRVTAARQLRGSGLVEAHPALAAYVTRGEARPAFGRALEAQRKGFTGHPPESAAMLAMQGEDA